MESTLLVRALVLWSGLGAMACAGGVPAPAAPVPATPVPAFPATVPFRGVPGFDTNRYPGDAAMAHWRAESPYRWVGYYLPAPCHTDTSWVGRRTALEQAGRADSLAAAEGFAPGSAIFLDVERVDTVSADLASYVRSWVATLLDGGRFVPALYLHARNLAALGPILESELTRHGFAATPRVWLAGGSGPFDVHAAPAEAGVAGISIWQGAGNVRESWGGVTLSIDVDVADAASPSAPGRP